MIDLIGAIRRMFRGQSSVMDFWSDIQEEVVITAAMADVALPNVVVAGLPAGVTITRVVAMIKFRVIENTNVAANRLTGAQTIEVRDDTPGTWRTAINFADDLFHLAASIREGGDMYIGDNDIIVEVDGNDTYNFQWADGDADLANLQFNEVQVGLRIYFTA